MNIHEYQAKELLQTFGVPVPAGGVAFNAIQARQAAEEIGGSRWVVKAQIHAGGRGKAGGVKVVDSLDEVKKVAKALLARLTDGPRTVVDLLRDTPPARQHVGLRGMVWLIKLGIVRATPLE